MEQFFDSKSDNNTHVLRNYKSKIQYLTVPEDQIDNFYDIYLNENMVIEEIPYDFSKPPLFLGGLRKNIKPENRFD